MGLPPRCLSRLSITTSPVRAFTIATSNRSLDAAAWPLMLSIVISKWTMAGFAAPGARIGVEFAITHSFVSGDT